MQEFMMRQEEGRRQHEIELMEKQVEIERLWNEEIRKNRRADKMEPWRDSDQPEAYLVKFERVMAEAGIPKKEWPKRLVPLLTGKALVAYSSHVPPAATNQYDNLKEAMLEAMGFSLSHCRRAFWTHQKKHSDTPQEICQQLEFYLNHLMQNCKTVADCKCEFLIGKLLSYYPPEVAEFVLFRKPQTSLEAANLIQDHQDGRQFWRDRRQGRPWNRRSYDRNSGPEEEGYRHDSAGGLRDGEYRHGHDSEKCEADKNGQFKYGGRPSGGKDQSSRFGGSSGNSMGDRQDGVWIPTCYKCGKKGHKRPECPSWVGRIITPTRKESLKVDGKIGSMTIDTGAQQTVVRADLVEDHEYTRETIRLMGYN